MIELMMVVVILGLITPALLLFFQQFTWGMAADEMRTQLQTLNQNTFLRIHERLGLCTHMFQGNASGGLSFINNLHFSATAPATVAGSSPAVVQTNAVTSFASNEVVSSEIGNELFFAAYDTPQNINGKFYNAPLTTTGGTVDSSGVTVPVVIDIYRFWLYYLTANPHGPRDLTTYRLVEWQSIQMADASEIYNMADATLQTNVIKWLATNGNADPGNGSYAITLAYDPHASSPVTAFYTLASSGTYTQVSSATIQPVSEGTWSYITHVSSGILSGGFRYGVLGNTWGGSGQPTPTFGQPNIVPRLAAPSGAFPGGFEIGLSGTANAREALFRSILVGKGSPKLPVYNDQASVVNFYDIW
jgi:type II secretory pathway pseudopilin PulG